MATIKPTQETFLAAKTFAIEHGHDEVIYEEVLGDEVAYYVHDRELDGACAGFPLYILVDKDLNCRFSSWEESLAVM